MIRRITHAARAAVLLLMSGLIAQGLFVPAAGAQGQQQPKSTDEMTEQQKQQQQLGRMEQTGSESLLRGKNLIGMDIRNHQDQKLGSVDNVAIDRSLDKAAYVSVSRGGVWGMGGDHVAVPIEALNKQPGENYLVLKASQDQFDKAPTFKSDNWPASADRQYWSQIGALPQQGIEQRGTEGMGEEQRTEPLGEPQGDVGAPERGTEGMGEEQRTEPFGEPQGDVGAPERGTEDFGGQQGRIGEREGTVGGSEPGAREQRGDTQMGSTAAIHKLSEVTNLNVKDRMGEDLGSIDDVYIDMHEGRLVYGLLSFKDVQGLENKMAVVPWNVLDVRPDAKVATINTGKDTLQAVAFSAGDFPALSEQYLSRISQRFNTEPYWEVFGYPPPRPAEGADIEKQPQKEMKEQGTEEQKQDEGLFDEEEETREY